MERKRNVCSLLKDPRPYATRLPPLRTRRWGRSACTGRLAHRRAPPYPNNSSARPKRDWTVACRMDMLWMVSAPAVPNSRKKPKTPMATNINLRYRLMLQPPFRIKNIHSSCPHYSRMFVLWEEVFKTFVRFFVLKFFLLQNDQILQATFYGQKPRSSP